MSDSVTPWTVVRQAPLSMGFPGQIYQSGLPFLSPGNLSNPGIKPRSSALQADSLLLSHQGRPQCRTRFNSWVEKIPWRREWQPTPIFLPGEFQGQRSLVGYSPWGHIELDRTERLTHTHCIPNTVLCYISNSRKIKAIFFNVHPHVHCSTIDNRTWKQPRRPRT